MSKYSGWIDSEKPENENAAGSVDGDKASGMKNWKCNDLIGGRLLSY